MRGKTALLILTILIPYMDALWNDALDRICLNWAFLSAVQNIFKAQVACPTDRSKALVPVLFLFCVALWFILRGLHVLNLPVLFFRGFRYSF